MENCIAESTAYFFVIILNFILHPLLKSKLSEGQQKISHQAYSRSFQVKFRKKSKIWQTKWSSQKPLSDIRNISPASVGDKKNIVKSYQFGSLAQFYQVDIGNLQFLYHRNTHCKRTQIGNHVPNGHHGKLKIVYIHEQLMNTSIIV